MILANIYWAFYMLTLKNIMKDILLSPFCRPGSRHSILLNITANKEEFRVQGNRTSCMGTGPVQLVTQGPIFGFILCCPVLKFLIVFWQRALHFHLAWVTTNYAAIPAWFQTILLVLKITSKNEFPTLLYKS